MTMKSEDKVTVLILVDRMRSWQKEKAKLLIQSFTKLEDVMYMQETRDDIHIETKTHFIRIIGITQSSRGYRANFIIDFSGLQDAQDTAHFKSTYNWGGGCTNGLNEVVRGNGWELE